jgi:hypothetical protein
LAVGTAALKRLLARRGVKRPAVTVIGQLLRVSQGAIRSLTAEALRAERKSRS